MVNYIKRNMTITLSLTLILNQNELYYTTIIVMFNRKKVLPICKNLREFPQTFQQFSASIPTKSRLLTTLNFRQFSGTQYALLFLRVVLSHFFPQFPGNLTIILKTFSQNSRNFPLRFPQNFRKFPQIK